MLLLEWLKDARTLNTALLMSQKRWKWECSHREEFAAKEKPEIVLPKDGYFRTPSSPEVGVVESDRRRPPCDRNGESGKLLFATPLLPAALGAGSNPGGAASGRFEDL